MKKITRKQELMAVVLMTAVVALIVGIIYWRYPNLEPENTPQDITVKKINPANGEESVIVTENQGGVKTPHILQKSDGGFLVFFLNADNVLCFVELDDKHTPVGDIHQYTEKGIQVTSFDAVKSNNLFYLTYVRFQENKNEFVLEKINDQGLVLQTNILANSFSEGQFTGLNQETYNNPILIFQEDSIFLFTQINSESNQYRVRSFDADLHETGVQKDLNTAKTRIVSGKIEQALILEDKNYLIVTTQEHGTDVCPTPDKTTQTELMALAYDKDWNFLDEKVLLTDNNKISHHPLHVEIYHGRIYILYYTNDGSKNMPQCVNGDIPVEGLLQVTFYNKNLTRLQTINVHDGKNGTARKANFHIDNDIMSIVYELSRNTKPGKLGALMFKQFDINAFEIPNE